MTAQEYEDLFGDGWRDPGDDTQRLMVYLLMFVGLVAFAALTVYALWGLAHPAAFGRAMNGNHETSLSGAKLGAFGMVIVGAAFGLLCLVFLLKESKTWDLKHLTMERFVAGGFLLGFAIMLVGVEILQAHNAGQGHSPMGAVPPAAICFALGAADLVFFLMVGLVCALLPKLKRVRRLKGVTVDSRLAIDDKLTTYEDHPCPWDDGLEAVVRLRLRDGSRLWVRPTHTAYEFAATGSFGEAVVRGPVLEKFDPKQRIGPVATQ